MACQLCSSQGQTFRIPCPAAAELNFCPISLLFPFKVPITESTKPIFQGSLLERVPVTPLQC